MSLLHPTPGEMHDRASVLMLKIRAFEKEGKDPSQLKKEQNEISVHLLKNFPPTDRDFLGELYLINSHLWDAENSIRSSGEDTVQHIALVAKRIAYLNDERNRLIRETDKAYGCENPVEEKIYR